MMGMKKFSSGRKQVLNLDGSPNENRPSWKSKYEQICAVHVNNGDPVSPKEEEDERIEPKKSTALIGLSGYHSTESSSDDSDLEDEVRSFLREVDNIYIVERAKPIVKPPTNPTVEKIQKLAKEMQAKQNMSAERKGDPTGPKAPTNTTAWQECYDNSTGFTYYWNMETNDVTWDMPLEYQAYVEALKHWQQQQANGVVARMQQARAQHLQQQHQQQQHQQQQIQQKQEMQTLLSLPKPPKEERVFKYCKKKKKDSDDEKIELITSYGPNSGDEDWSDQETSKKKKDKTDKAEKKSVETSHKTHHHRRKVEEPKPIGSLVPYHHDDSESDEPQVSKEDEIKLKLASKIREIQSSDSNSNLDDESAERLKNQEIDSDSESKLKINLKSKITARAKQIATLGTFENPELSEDSKDKDDFVSTVSNPFSSESNNLIENTSGVGIKRKLKIEIPQPPRKEESPFRDSVKDAEKTKEADGSKRQKIEKIQFIKAETLQPQKEESTAETDAIDIKDVSNLLLDKMKFLSASKDPVSAVQLWTIQLETLVSAWESNDLKRSYISDWLTNTMKELERLESTVAPEGWLCQWQRKEKCYSYTNERTGRVVWEFPQASDMDEKDAETEKIGGEEDMEVCTTPPPPSSPPIRDPSPPPPPHISPPTPPPPPSISHPDENPILPPLPPLPPPSEPPTPPPPPPDEPPPHLLMEPLPPGVDAPELLRPMPLEYPVAIPSQIGMHLIPQLHYTLYPQPTLASALALQPRISKSGDLSSELDSFYSDLASLEPAEQPSQPSLPSKESTPPLPQTPTLDTDAAAKKKKKTKLAPGLALKKKGVSSLVAKWQQVQEDVRRDLKNIDN